MWDIYIHTHTHTHTHAHTHIYIYVLWNAAMWMDLKNIMLIKQVRQKKTKLSDINYMWNLKTNEQMYILKT